MKKLFKNHPINLPFPILIFQVKIQNSIESENAIKIENGDEIQETQLEGENKNLEEIPLRRSIQTTQPSTRLRDLVTYKVEYLIQKFVTYDNVFSNYEVFLSSISNQQVK